MSACTLQTPEATIQKIVRAGLLTFFFPAAFPFRNSETVAWSAENIWKITASGNVRDFHPVPFSSCFLWQETLTRAKVI